MIRLILYIILFYVIYHTIKKFMVYLFPPRDKVRGQPRQKVRPFDPKDIEDIDYKEVKRDNERQTG